MNANGYGEYLKDFRGLSPKTITSYEWVVSAFQNKVGKKSAYSREDIVNYIQNLSGCKTYKRWTAQVLKVYLAFLGQDWLLSPKEMPKYSTPHRKMIEIEDAKTVLKLVKEQSILDYTVIKVIIITGMRRGELTELLLENFKPPYLKMVLGKSSGRELTKKLDPGTVSEIVSYLRTRKDQEPYLIVNSHGHKLQPENITQIFYRWFKKAGLERKSPHAGRRSVVTWLYNKGKGMGIKELQEAMGWKSPTMPLLYCMADNDEMLSKSMELNPMLGKVK